MKLIDFERLKPGDKIATVSLSAGTAGELPWRYQTGKEYIESHFSLEVVEMDHTLMSANFIADNPQCRAKDLMDAFIDPSIKGIFSNIGGYDAIQLLPYIDFNIMKNNPKVFLGYSDSSIIHMMCLKAGIASVYGPSVLAEFAENNGMFEYSENSLKKALFDSEMGIIEPSPIWTAQRIEWDESLNKINKKMLVNSGPVILSGSGITSGHLIGGCLESLYSCLNTEIFPDKSMFKNSILFLETSQVQSKPCLLESFLMELGVRGVLNHLNGILFAKPSNDKFQEEYHQVILKVLTYFSCSDLMVMANLNFGHNEPMFSIPYGRIAEINSNALTLKIA